MRTHVDDTGTDTNVSERGDEKGTWGRSRAPQPEPEPKAEDHREGHGRGRDEDAPSAARI
jgi:hypothetical protein